jgi:proline dehydrogenase
VSVLFLAKRFVAGETTIAALNAVRDLNAAGLTASLDFLGENVTNPEEAQRTRDAYLHLLDEIDRTQARTNISVKLTALGLAFDEKLCVAYLNEIAERALQNGDPFVRIDMEGSTFTQKTLEIFENVYADRTNVGPVIQAYLKRSPADIERLIELNARVRLCKGAYREPRAVAQTQMSVIRRSYMLMAQALLSRGTYPGIATHDELLIHTVCSYAREHDISPNRFEFQMLYGVRPKRQRTLAQQGYNVRIYVPFGTHWASYLRRRISERPENFFFAARALLSK